MQDVKDTDSSDSCHKLRTRRGHNIGCKICQEQYYPTDLIRKAE